MYNFNYKIQSTNLKSQVPNHKSKIPVGVLVPAICLLVLETSILFFR
jgi:hypothetical protein